MKKKLFLLLILFIPLNVYASSGWLQKASIKTCPNGVTYGKHTDHWHVAVTDGERYYASGDVISSDPCPSSNTNQGTAGSTSSSSNSSSNYSSSSSSSSNYSNSSSSSNNTSNNNLNNYNSSNSLKNNSIDNTSAPETNEITEEVKNNNTSIKSISINGKKINKISNNMNYTIYKKVAKIKVKLEDDKATYKINGNTDNIIDSSKIEIVVSAEDGTTKTYYLNITRKYTKKDIYIEKFVFGAGELEFDKNNYAEAQILSNEHSFEYSYKLSNDNATLKIYKNNKEITKFDNVKNNDKYKLILYINNNKINEYTFKIKKLSKFITILVYIISIIIMILPIVFIVCLIKYIKKKNTKKLI